MSGHTFLLCFSRNIINLTSGELKKRYILLREINRVELIHERFRFK